MLFRQFAAVSVVMVCTVLAPNLIQARMVHDFDCTFCHLNYSSEEVPYMTYNVCLGCHYPGKEGARYTLSNGSDSNPITATFALGDGSNAMGSNSDPDDETSHFFAGGSDEVPAAGAVPPTDWRFNLGWATGQVTCSRCHNPHGDTSNPKLLKLGAGSADAMCLECHAPWDQTGNHGLTTHPLHADYPALAAANPDKFRAVPDNFGTEGAISLVDETKVSCTSCHGVHFVDSDASTPDGRMHGNDLSVGDGKLLKFDGPGREQPGQSLCQTCHTYAQHGGSAAASPGCMACHGGHEYDADGNPNYYILKKQVALANVPKTGSEGVVNIDYATYPVPVAESDGICLECHNLPASHDAGSSPCKNCHSHQDGFAHGDGDYGLSCLECHTGDHDTDKNQADWITFFNSSSWHASSEFGPRDTYATCSLCHETNVLTPHVDDCTLCHSGASPPRNSFETWNQTCQQASCHPSFHPGASDAHDTYYANIRNNVGSGNCDDCHTYVGWGETWDDIATADFCSECHSLRPDNTPPISQSNLRASYVDEALITITARDAFGVSAIYYNLDGSGSQVYSGPIAVAPPVSGTQAHTLEYWARDLSGNIEPANSGTFNVNTDTEPPITTSDAYTLYGTDATIQLTATDNATSHGVAATYFVFDDPGDTATVGTTAVMPEPASGAEEHTLYYWSVDRAGNVEDPPKESAFTIVSGGREPTALHLDQAVNFYTEPNASGPWIQYQIYVDDILKGTLTKDASDTQTTWDCPETPVSNGSHIDIVVDAGFDNHTGGSDGNAPYTYTFTLPDGVARLEATTWTGFSNLGWMPVEYEPGYGDFAYVVAPPSLIENVVYVTTSPDTTAPTTISNITSGGVYIGDHSFTLSASDHGGSRVNGTWWQLDSTAGSWNRGQTLTVNAPVSGTEAHILYWYSTDYAGNHEEIQSVSFNMEAVGTSTLTLPLDTWVEFAVDAQKASGPRVNYQIYIDDVLKGSLNQTQSSNETTWTCPETVVSAGSHIDIVVNTWFTNYNGPSYTNAPYTFTLDLPAGVKRIEAATWTDFPSLVWEQDAFWEDGTDEWEYDFVAMPTGTVSNIVYAGIQGDGTPPVTTIDATEGATYAGGQTFTLSPTDADSGVESTWWQLDGSGIWNIGTSLPVPAPDSGTATHTIEWYSRDHAANQETTRSVTFDVTAAGGG